MAGRAAVLSGSSSNGTNPNVPGADAPIFHSLTVTRYRRRVICLTVAFQSLGKVGLMSAARQPLLNWKKSVRCGTAACVEVALSDEAVYIRDAATPAVPLTFSHGTWRLFIGGLRAGAWTRPLD